MALDRLTLDQEGARTGELFAHTLQMGDDTDTLSNIATMGVETQKFRPYDTPSNRGRLRLVLGVASLAFVGCILTLAWWGLSRAPLISLTALLAVGLGVLFVILAGRGVYLSMKINRWQDYYRLSIGASDGRVISLVDNSRPVLEEVRDVIRKKIDMGDHTTVGTFDLNTDTVSVGPARAPAPDARPRYDA